MSIEIAYRVIEHYGDQAPEPFGVECFPIDQQPTVGSIVMLHWLDGREAYRVHVDEVNNLTLHVTAVRP